MLAANVFIGGGRCVGADLPDRFMVALTKAGRYEIAGELGRGAMGVVYRATDPVIGRTVAVKTIRLSTEGTGLSRAELLTRFRTEARAAGLLTHPNIVVVFDAGEEDGLYFITMELVEGKSLQTMLDARQPFPLPRETAYFADPFEPGPSRAHLVERME